MGHDPSGTYSQGHLINKDGNTESGKDMAFRVSEVVTNTPPAVTLPGSSLNFTENDPAAVIDSSAIVSDSDSSDIDTGTLTVDFSVGGTVNDRLAIRNQGTGSGQIGISGGDVTYNSGSGAVTIGTWTGGTDGSTPLVITFNNANSTPAAAEALTRNVTYQNVAVDPDTNSRTVRFVITDGDGGTSRNEL